MSVPFRRLGALALAVALSLGAAPIRRIKFTDTTLANGLRVIVAEDHERRSSPSTWRTTSARVTSVPVSPASRICSST